MVVIHVELWMHPNAGQGVCLLPELEPIKVKAELTYDGSGHLDFINLLYSLERGCQEQWGLRPALVAEARHDAGFMSQVKEAIIEITILVIPDILESFTPIEDSLQGEGENLRMSLRMNVSGTLARIPIRRDAGGGYDVEAVIEAPEDSYRRMLFMDSGADIFSGAQRSQLRDKIPAWLDGILGSAGFGLPQVKVDTEHVVWEEDALRMGVTLAPPDGAEPGGPEKQYTLSVPFAEGEPNYGGIEALANQAAREWAQDRIGAGQDAARQAVREHLQEVVPAYVSWAIAEQQKDVQIFWDAFNGELEKKLEEATKLEKKVEEVRAKLKKGVADLEVKTTNRFTPGITMGLSIAAKTLWKEIPGSMAEIAEGLSKLPGNMRKELNGSAAEIVKGLEFGFLAAGCTILGAGWIVLRDVATIAGPGIVVKIAQSVAKSVKVGSVLYRFARPVANLSAKGRKRVFIGEQIASGALTAGNVADFWFSAKDTAEKIAAINLKIKRMIYGDDH